MTKYGDIASALDCSRKIPGLEGDSRIRPLEELLAKLADKAKQWDADAEQAQSNVQDAEARAHEAEKLARESRDALEQQLLTLRGQRSAMREAERRLRESRDALEQESSALHSTMREALEKLRGELASAMQEQRAQAEEAARRLAASQAQVDARQAGLDKMALEQAELESKLREWEGQLLARELACQEKEPLAQRTVVIRSKEVRAKETL